MKAASFGALLFTMFTMVVVTDTRGEGGLKLNFDLPSHEVLERTPLVATVRVQNVGEPAVMTIFPAKEPAILEEYSSLVLKDSSGRTYPITYRGGPVPERPAPVADDILLPGEGRAVERLFNLVVWTAPAPTQVRRFHEQYAFLSPGTYIARFEVSLLQGKKLLSDEFTLSIVEAEGVDAVVRDKLHFRHVAFLEGRDRGDLRYYKARDWDEKADDSRFGELQKILDDFPDSEYAKWIRFWKLYHHGPIDDALRYAREDPVFPLSDNLMLHMSEGLFNKGEHARSREVLAELIQRFPDGDTRVPAQLLREKLTKKP